MMRAVRRLKVDDRVLLGTMSRRERTVKRISPSEAHAEHFGLNFTDGSGIVLHGDDTVEVVIDVSGFTEVTSTDEEFECTDPECPICADPRRSDNVKRSRSMHEMVKAAGPFRQHGDRFGICCGHHDNCETPNWPCKLRSQKP